MMHNGRRSWAVTVTGAAVAASTCLALSWAPSVAIAAEAQAGAVQLAAQFSNGLPKTVQFEKVTGEVASGETFTIVSTTSNDAHKRVIHIGATGTKLDRCKATKVDATLNPIDCEVKGNEKTGAHEWTVTKADGGYTVESKRQKGQYLNIKSGSAALGSEKQVLQLEKAGEDAFTLSCTIDGAKYYLSYASTGWTSSTTAQNVYLYQRKEVTPNVVPNEKPKPGTTVDQPFASNTAGSRFFRIPAMVAQQDGSLLAAIDARWNTTGDAGGLDTIVSRSTDGGKTWSYSFPNYFNDSADAYNSRATAFIDPVLVQKGNTTYMMVDLWPGGVALNSAANNHPVDASGYVEIDGHQRLVLFASANPDEQRAAGAERGEGYTHYVGDFDASGYAPVIKKDGGETSYYVNREFYLFNADKEPVYCQQLGTSDYVQQNVFYYNADLHVTATSYLWMVNSTDGGATWSAPLMLNEQVRTNLKEKNSSFYGVGPGRGLVTSSGRIVLPCYTFEYGKGDGKTSVIYSDDGVNWKRSESLDHQTSEATVVEADGKLYIFARHGWYAVSTDGGATWGEEKSLRETGIPVDTGCQINAITYSEKIDGKTAILLSCPTGSSRRTNGSIFVGLVQPDGSLSWDYEYKVTTGGTWYAYSCLTELPNGSVSVLYETTGDTAKYENFAIEDIAKNAQIGNERELAVPLYGEVEFKVKGSLTGFDAADKSIAGISVKDNGDGTSTVTVKGLKEGKTSFTGSDDVDYSITVAPEQLVEKTINPGETFTAPVKSDKLTHEPDTSIATAKITVGKASEVLGETVGTLGSDANYKGDVEVLSKSLYTFDKGEDGKWTVSATLENGTKTYVKLGDKGKPNKKQAGKIEIKAGTGDRAGQFKLYDSSVQGGGKHLHFWRDGKNVFDQCGGSTCNDDYLELYRPAKDGEQSSTAIPGYVQVKTADEVTSGGKYLVAANYQNTRYVLHPTTEQGSMYDNVIKVNPDAPYNVLTVTGVAAGTTDVAVDGVVYRVTVRGYLAPVFTWADDYSSATATFNRNDGGDAKTVDAVVTSERVEPTPTEDGQITYTATVEFEGKTYTDTKTVVLPATGETDPEQPEKPEKPEQPTDPQRPGKPSKPSERPGSALPQTGDPAAFAGIAAAVGAGISALGARMKRRWE
ncbi:MAG: exo-alpha-sialidase [Coriobacteriaceae bacterium]|nr:exo-alpha-sialidase [Coriobacteriaceae bacterium]